MKMKSVIAILTISLAYGTAHAATYLDDFNRADGSLGANWTTTGGDFSITNGVVDNYTTGNVVAYWNKAQTLNGGTNGFAISATVTLNANANTAWTGLAFNYQNPTNFFSLRFSGFGEVQMLRVVNGSLSTFYNAPGVEFAHVPNRPYLLEVSSVEPYVFRASIKDTVTDTVVWSSASIADTGSNFEDGYGGFFASSLGRATYDDFALMTDVFQDDYNVGGFGAFNTDASVSIGPGYVLSQLSGDKLAQARILQTAIQLKQTVGTANAANVVLRYSGIELKNADSNESFVVEGDIKTKNNITATSLYGLAFNYQPDGSFYAARINTGNAANVLQFLRVNSAGAIGAFGSVPNPVALATNATYHLVIESSEPGVFDYMLTGPDLDGGALSGTATDTVLKLENGQAGFYASGIATDYLFDNLFIKISLPPEQLAGGYEGWSTGWGVDIGADTNDYDNDGLLNVYEYGLGGDPTDDTDQGVSPEFDIVNTGGTNWFGYVHPQLADPASGITYHLELNTDLVSGTWVNAGYEVLGTNDTGGDLDFVTNVTDTVDSQKYLRLIIESL